MQGRNWLVAAIAIAVGLIAVVIANAWFSGVEQRTERDAENQQLVQIVVATQPFEFGTKLVPQNIKLDTRNNRGFGNPMSSFVFSGSSVGI